MQKLYYVYIISNYDRKVIYIGVTDDLIKRVYQHKNGLADGFTKKYRGHDLVFYEVYENPETAILREKQLKSWNRPRKNRLILEFNPKMIDLYPTLL